MSDASKAAMEDVACVVCGSEERRPHGELVGYSFHRCSGCGLVYMSPRPTAEALTALYDESYFESSDPNVGYAVYESDRESVRDKSRRLLDRIERHGGRGRLLDIGCAHGFLLELARERGFEVEGVEPAEDAARRTADRLGIEVASDLFGARFDDDSFDVVTAWDVIEHLPDPVAVIEEIRRIAKPGALVSVVTPDVESLAARVLGARWEEMRKMPEHICFYSRSSLTRLAAGAGLTPIEWGTVGKLMSLDEAATRVGDSLPRVLAPLMWPFRKPPLGRIRFHLDPRWKLSLLLRAEAGDDG